MVIIQEASSSSSPPSTRPWKYHVFLSFRGEDTRYNFTDHLYNALRREGIITFMDDKLRRGEDISTALLQAIEESKISIIVFSEKYASSKWCLDELVKILECKESNQQKVLPVFYKVDPSDIRNHRGSFGEALANHECKFNDNSDRVQKWKSALSKAANLSGWPLSNEHSESELIQDIVEEISQQVRKHTYLNVAKYPVGIEPRVQHINELLGVQGEDVCMIGIWGLGGIGKTTIVKAVYNSISHKFEGRSFVENVRENSMCCRGFVKLQENLLYEILGDKVEVPSVARGITMIKEMLQYRKVLLVLDDVDDIDQLNNLAGDCSWFGMRSRIIIVTRDRQLLRSHNVKEIYEVEELDHHEALELFSWNAFKRNAPLDDYVELTERALRYAQGLPLALSVLGSYLCGGNVELWQAALDSCFKSPKIRDVLKISYDGLDDTVKEIFLDLACFFKNGDRDHVIRILEAYRHKPVKYGVNVLIEKALVSITDDDYISMHDLLEEMGRDIVHQESPNDPGKRSRLFNHEDVYHVLTENTGTNNVIGIKINLPKESDVIYLSSTTFSNMRNLRLFIHRAGRFSGVVDNLPNSLRVVDWPDSGSHFLPSNLIHKELAMVDMPRSHITALGERYKLMVNLTSINLYGCEYLTKVSDLSRCPNLQHLDLGECKNLVEVHPAVGFLDKLNYLSLWGCRRLETFPTEVSWKSMRKLLLAHCKRLEKIINIAHKMESIKELDLSGSGIKELSSWIRCCTSLKGLRLDKTPIKELPSSIEYLTFLEELEASKTLIEELPLSIGKLTSLTHMKLSEAPIKGLPQSIGKLTSLEELDLSKTLIKVLPPSIGDLTSLEALDLSKTLIKVLPQSIGKLNSLITLDAYETLIEVLPQSFGNLTSLEALDLSKTSLKELPDSIGYLTSLGELDASKTPIKELSSTIVNLTSLWSLDVSETLIEELPLQIGKLTSLTYLKLSKTPVKELPQSIGKLTSLMVLDASETRIKELPSSIRNLTSLEEMYLFETLLKELPSSIGDLTSLWILNASETLIEELPLSIGNLTRFRSLSLRGCANLANVYGGLQHLQYLDLSWCPKLVTFPRGASGLVSSSAESLRHGHDHPAGSLLFPNLRSLHFKGCKLSVLSDFLTNLDCVSTLQTLNLSGSSLDCLPACISKFRNLEYLYLGGCKKLRDISELPPDIEYIKLDDCVSLESFSKLSNILEQKDSPEFLRRMDLSNCQRLVVNLGTDMVSKMAKALLNQLVYGGVDGHVKCWKLTLPSLPGIEVPKWFDRGEVDTSVLSGCKSTNDICEILIKISKNLKCDRIGLVLCLVFEFTQDFCGDSCGTAVTVVIDGEQYDDSTGVSTYYTESSESSGHDHVFVCLTCIDFKDLEVVDHVVRVIFNGCISLGKGLLLKSYGVHLANMKDDQDHESREALARERYRRQRIMTRILRRVFWVAVLVACMAQQVLVILVGCMAQQALVILMTPTRRRVFRFGSDCLLILAALLANMAQQVLLIFVSHMVGQAGEALVILMAPEGYRQRIMTRRRVFRFGIFCLVILVGHMAHQALVILVAYMVEEALVILMTRKRYSTRRRVFRFGIECLLILAALLAYMAQQVLVLLVAHMVGQALVILMAPEGYRQRIMTRHGVFRFGIDCLVLLVAYMVHQALVHH